MCLLQQLMFWADGKVADSKHCFWASGKDPQRGRLSVLREGGKEKSIPCRSTNGSTEELTHNWKSKKTPSDLPIQSDCIPFTRLGQSNPSRPCSRD